MAKVKFFASLRDLVGELEKLLSAEGYEAICAASVKIALNHEIVEPEFEIRQNDEIAFLPPITGG